VQIQCRESIVERLKKTQSGASHPGLHPRRLSFLKIIGPGLRSSEKIHRGTADSFTKSAPSLGSLLAAVENSRTRGIGA
jgi:hypothetical protein